MEQAHLKVLKKKICYSITTIQLKLPMYTDQVFCTATSAYSTQRSAKDSTILSLICTAASRQSYSQTATLQLRFFLSNGLRSRSRSRSSARSVWGSDRSRGPSSSLLDESDSLLLDDEESLLELLSSGCSNTRFFRLKRPSAAEQLSCFDVLIFTLIILPYLLFCFEVTCAALSAYSRIIIEY